MQILMVRWLRVGIDLTGLGCALVAAFLLRFEGDVPLLMVKRLVFLLPYVVFAQYVTLRLFRIHLFSWRLFGLRETVAVARALGVAAFLFLMVRLVAARVAPSWGYANYVILPIGVILIDGALAFLAVAGARISLRLRAERRARSRPRPTHEKRKRTLLIGASEAGLAVAKELDVRPEMGILPVGFLDDDPAKREMVIHGLRVLGDTASLAEVCATHSVQEVLITLENAPGSEVRRINDACRAAGVPAKIIPGLFEIVGGRVNLSRIREVSITDLLGREPTLVGDESLSAAITGKVVLVTGAGGSIGSELCRQLLQLSPERLLLVEQAETSLFFIHRELLALRNGAETEIVPLIADVVDRSRIQQILARYEPRAVFHAAAHKHVPMMELNPAEAIKNNILGTRVMADASVAAGVERFVMISTDKAVNPSSVMGCSKRIAEMYVQTVAEGSETKFTAVRFGNVLGSAGSVIPIFKQQIAAGGPVAVTHPEMTRYFMTIPEACQLVLQAGTMGLGGEIFILDMGKPVKIVDLARDLITLSGLEPGSDIEIVFTGIRPGEKLHEELSTEDEAAQKTRHPKIFIGTQRTFDRMEFLSRIDALVARALSAEPCDYRVALKQIVPEFLYSEERR